MAVAKANWYTLYIWLEKGADDEEPYTSWLGVVPMKSQQRIFVAERWAWWRAFSSSFIHVRSHRWRHPSFLQSQPSPFPPAPPAPCSIGHPFSLLHWISLTCLFHSKTRSSNPSFYNYCSFFPLLFSNKLFARLDYSHHRSFLSPINNLACLPSIPPKVLLVYFSNLLIAQCIFQTLSS